MDMLKMKEMLSKKKLGSEGEMSDMEKNAKVGVMQHMRDMASNGLTDKLKGLKKVTVASDSKPGMVEGLEKAREMVGETPEGSDSLEEKGEIPGMEGSLEEEHEGDCSHMSDEELDMKMHELMQEKMNRKGAKL